MTLKVGDLVWYHPLKRRSFNNYGVITEITEGHIDFNTLDDYDKARARPDSMRRAVITFGGPAVPEDERT